MHQGGSVAQQPLIYFSRAGCLPLSAGIPCLGATPGASHLKYSHGPLTEDWFHQLGNTLKESQACAVELCRCSFFTCRRRQCH